MIIDISIDNKVEKCFIIGKKDKKLKNIQTKNLILPELVEFISILKTDSNNEFFIKIIPSKYKKTDKFKFFLRNIIAERLLFNTKAIKEYKHSKKLASIGISTPKVYAGGFFLSNIERYSGIIIYEKLDNTITVREMLLSNKPQEDKSIVLEKIYEDYKKMALSKIHFRDFHMSNILVNPDTLDIYWIDPSLKKLS